MNLDWDLAITLVTACIQSQHAFHDGPGDDRAMCYPTCPHPDDPTDLSPAGYERIDCFTGVTGGNYPVECFGLIYRSTTETDSYAFSFRGSKSRLDWLHDFDFAVKHPFVPFSPNAQPEVPQGAAVAQGFWKIYASSYTGTQSTTLSMQHQLFNLLAKYQPKKLYITGHSLGGALCELFTLDLALSTYRKIQYCNYNYGCPMVGNKAFADFYDSEDTPTLRVQNVDDIVPCNPSPVFDYKQVGQVYVIGFHGNRLLPEDKVLDNHMAQNYKPVLVCARNSLPNRVCDNPAVPVPAPTMT
ncbi:MAG: lipase family protein, partial [Candidatus Dormibacteraceae bacterium]